MRDLSYDRVAKQLRHAGLRPTRRRVDLGRVLFAKGHRHVAAEDLHAEAEVAGVSVSLATVYNTLNLFTAAGLVSQVEIDSRTYFDTNTTDHHHFFVEADGTLIDFVGDVGLDRLPDPPKGMEIVSVDVVVRVRAAEVAERSSKKPA